MWACRAGRRASSAGPGEVQTEARAGEKGRGSAGGSGGAAAALGACGQHVAGWQRPERAASAACFAAGAAGAEGAGAAGREALRGGGGGSSRISPRLSSPSLSPLPSAPSFGAALPQPPAPSPSAGGLRPPPLLPWGCPRWSSATPTWTARISGSAWSVTRSSWRGRTSSSRSWLRTAASSSGPCEVSRAAGPGRGGAGGGGQERGLLLFEWAPGAGSPAGSRWKAPRKLSPPLPPRRFASPRLRRGWVGFPGERGRRGALPRPAGPAAPSPVGSAGSAGAPPLPGGAGRPRWSHLGMGGGAQLRDGGLKVAV